MMTKEKMQVEAKAECTNGTRTQKESFSLTQDELGVMGTINMVVGIENDDRVV